MKKLSKSLIAAIQSKALTAGCGTTAAHTPVTATGWEEEDQYIYAIEMYTDGVIFDELKEDDADVTALRKNAGGAGYPKGTQITGRFTSVKPASGHVVGAFTFKP